MRKIMCILVITILALPAQAHSTEEIEAWMEDWESRLPEAGLSINDPLVEELVDFRERHRWYFDPEPVVVAETSNSSSSQPRTVAAARPVEEWRPLVEKYFRAEDVNTALCIISKESGGNPNAKNPNSSAWGLWQFLRQTWNWVADTIGGPSYESGGPTDPETSTRFAAWLRDTKFGFSAWNPYKRGEC